MTELQLCDFETAKMLKEAGFDWPLQKSFYFNYGEWKEGSRTYEVNYNGFVDSEKYFSRPTLEHAAMWLREAKRVNVNAYPDDGAWDYNIYDLDKYYSIAGCFNLPTYSDALTAGIKKALEIITTKTN
jgi:hypothetical protein